MQRGIYLRGVWDLPVLRNIKDVINMGLDSISKNPEIVELLEQVLPKAASLLARTTPITAEYADDIEKAVNSAINATMHDNYRLKGLTEEQAIALRSQSQPKIIKHFNSIESLRAIDSIHNGKSTCEIEEL